MQTQAREIGRQAPGRRGALASGLTWLVLFAWAAGAQAGGPLPAEAPLPTALPAEDPCGLPPGAPAIYRVEVPPHAAIRGSADDALITIVEFSEFQCPFCARVDATLVQLMEKYPGQIRHVFRHNPLDFHKDAKKAAQAALAAGLQGKFWQMHDLLFQNRSALDEDNLFGYASKLGLDMSRFQDDFQSVQIQKWIDADQQAASRLKANGVPTFFINGRELRGAQPLEKFTTLIDELLPEARRMGGGGEQLYRRLTACGRETKPAAPPRAEVKSQPRPAAEAPVDPVRVPLEDSYWVGSPLAPVTLVVFSDFQCPYCARLNKTFVQLLEDYPQQLKIVFKHNPLPFHKQAKLAAEAALAAGSQGKFWQMHDLLFANARSLDRESIERLAGQLGLDVYRFRSELDQGAYTRLVERDMALAKELGAKGTPTSFINGYRLVGAAPIASFKEKIDAQLGRR